MTVSFFSTPPVWFFKAWQYLQLVPTLLITLVPIAMISLWSLAILVDTITWVACNCIMINHDKLPSCCKSSWSKQITSIGLYLTNKVGRALCPPMFPGLFTKHKMRAQAQESSAEVSLESSPKVYIVFLNRNLNDHFAFLLVFSLLSILVLAASATAFLTSFSPVSTGTQCLEEDKNGHSLLCYTDNSAYPENCSNLTNHAEANVALYIGSISQSRTFCDTEDSDNSENCNNSTNHTGANFTFCIKEFTNMQSHSLFHTDNSDYPVNYTNSTNRTGANITYTCYPWTIRTFGVAFASAMGIFKFAIFFTTAYVQISDWCFRNCCSSCKIGRICKWTVMIGLGLSGVICLLQTCYSFVIMTNKSPKNMTELLTMISELSEYTYLPMWLCLGLAVITWNLEEYCKQTEFNTLSPDQLPPPSPLPQQLPPSSPLPQQESQSRSFRVAVAT